MIMKKNNHGHALPLPIMVAELAFASWETIYHRGLMIAMGSCSMTEWQRMVLEKSRAAHQSALAMATPGGDVAAAIAPYHSRATANARRLRKK